MGGGYDAFGSGSSNEGDIVGFDDQVFIAFEGFFSQRKRSTDDGTLVFRRMAEPSGLLISAVFNEIVLPKTVGVTLHKIELGIVVACSSLKLCERGGDRPRCSGGGIPSAVALELKSRMSIDKAGPLGAAWRKWGLTILTCDTAHPSRIEPSNGAAGWYGE